MFTFIRKSTLIRSTLNPLIQKSGISFLGLCKGCTSNRSRTIFILPFESSMHFCTLKEAEEVKIKVPYGHISGKVWNKNGNRTPILALHGWLDNSGSWDHISPYLDDNYPIIAIDFPGHGDSSPKPLGSIGCFNDNIMHIERVVNHFNWKKFILLGHSMGGAASMLYAGTFPGKVEKLVMIDLLKPIHVEADEQPGLTALSIAEHLAVEKKLMNTEPPQYSYSEILEKTVLAYKKSLSEEAAKTLLKRGVVKHDEDSYSYAHSPFLKVNSILSLTLQQQKSFASKVKCDMLLIKCSDAPLYAEKEVLREFINIYKKNCCNFTFEVANGTHHAHLNNPEIVAPLINDFLNNIPQNGARKTLSDNFIANTFF